MMKMMEQTDGYVVAGAFEDDPALMNQEQYYSVRLAHTVYAARYNEIVINLH